MAKGTSLKSRKSQSKAFTDAARELGGDESLDHFNAALRAVGHIRSSVQDDEHYKRLIGADPPWLHLLRPDQKAWREKEVLKGRDPNSYIESELRKSGRWPEKKSKRK